MFIIGQRIKKIRNDLGLSFRQFASILQVNPSAVFYWENGKRKPCIENTYKILEIARKNGIEIDFEWIRPY